MKRLLAAGRIPPGSPGVWELRLPLRRPPVDARVTLRRAQGGDLTPTSGNVPPAGGEPVVIPILAFPGASRVRDLAPADAFDPRGLAHTEP